MQRCQAGAETSQEEHSLEQDPHERVPEKSLMDKEEDCAIARAPRPQMQPNLQMELGYA